MPRGGARPGAGRPAKRIKFAAQVNAAEQLFANHAERAAERLIELAEGGFERTTRVYKAAGLLNKAEYEKVIGERGGEKMVKKEVPAFADLKPTDMVLVEERVEPILPDRAANEYILDRVAGTPGSLEDAPEKTEAEIKIDDQARADALKKAAQWQQKAQERLALIRNPVTGETIADSQNSEASTNLESSTMDEF